MSATTHAGGGAQTRTAGATQTPKKYEGIMVNGQTSVTVNGHELNPRLDLRKHSPDGFQWGYGGSGPAQLALALLADCLEDDDRALAHYQEFKRKVVVVLPRNSWTLTSDEIHRVVQALAQSERRE